MIKVAVLGACGKMGREVVKTILDASDTELVGACDVVSVGSRVSDIVGIQGSDVLIENDVISMLDNSKPDVVVDFAKPFVLKNIKELAKRGIVSIIGTTGESAEDLAELEKTANETNTGIIVAPNFAVGAILMMKFAAEAAKYMPSVEIVELHHDKKLDSPSGTSIKTAEMIVKSRQESNSFGDTPLGNPDDSARGDHSYGVHIHSVRLPGLVAHQEVMFGGTGQLLTLRHDSLDRTSFMPGVLLAVRKAKDIKTFVYGLDKLM